jgi:hypothetical protein
MKILSLMRRFVASAMFRLYPRYFSAPAQLAAMFVGKLGSQKIGPLSSPAMNKQLAGVAIAWI